MRFGVLGALELIDDAGATVQLGSSRLRRLLAALLVHAGTVLSADRLADILWGDHQPENPANALHALVSRLRRALGGGDVLLTRVPGYVLALPESALDAAVFTDLVEHAKAAADHPGDAAVLLDEALSLWRGPAYAEFADDDFARAEAARLDELWVTASEDRLDVELALGRPAEAVARAEALVAIHPLRERPHCQLMLANYRAGRQPDALSIYRRYRQRLDDELGLAPSSAMLRLEGEILRQDPVLDLVDTGDAAPRAQLPAAPGRGGNLCPPVTGLIGRDRDREYLIAALIRARVVTLTGVGGVGKTLLAFHAAADAAGKYADGAWLVELAAVRKAAHVVDALNTTLGVRQRAGIDPAGRLVEYLRPKRLLLVLDNCEHVVEAAAAIVEAIATGCPGVTVLATSREPLGVAGENLQPVAPLDVPAPGIADADAVARVPSVQLLLDRAVAAAPRFALEPANLPAIVEICRRLDGVPLAIELAAPKLRAMSPAEVADRLDARFPFLRSGRRIAAERQRTLREVVDWSYELLDEPQRRVFERLAVFVGPFTVAAAEQVCADVGADVLGTVVELVDRSMVVAHVAGSGNSRYTLLETMRHYGRDRLAERGDEERASRAHALWAVDYTEQAEPLLQGPEEAWWVESVGATTDELRAAHDWAVEHDLDLDIRLVAALNWYAEFQVNEMLGWARRTLEVAERVGVRHPRLPVVYAMAAVHSRFRGDMAQMAALAGRGAELAYGRSDPAGWSARNILADVEFFAGRLVEAERLFVDLEQDTRSAGDRYRLCVAQWMLALGRTYRGDHGGGLHYAQLANREARALGNPTMIAWACYSEAEALLDADPDRALRLLNEAMALARTVGNRYLVGVAAISAASLEGRHGDPRQALQQFRDVLTTWHEAGGWTQLWTAMRWIIGLLSHLQADEDAAVLYGAALNSATALPAYGEDADRLAVAAQTLTQRLGADRLAEALRRGADLSDDDAVAAAQRAIDATTR